MNSKTILKFLENWISSGRLCETVDSKGVEIQFHRFNEQTDGANDDFMCLNDENRQCVSSVCVQSQMIWPFYIQNDEDEEWENETSIRVIHQ